MWLWHANRRSGWRDVQELSSALMKWRSQLVICALLLMQLALNWTLGRLLLALVAPLVVGNRLLLVICERTGWNRLSSAFVPVTAVLLLSAFGDALEYAAVRSVPFVPIPREDLNEIFRLAECSNNDTLLELGAGDLHPLTRKW